MAAARAAKKAGLIDLDTAIPQVERSSLADRDAESAGAACVVVDSNPCDTLGSTGPEHLIT
jgi:hypothetical protein